MTIPGLPGMGAIPTSGAGSGAAAGANGHLLYDVAGIETAAQQLHSVMTQTADNWQRSVTLLQQSQDTWHGAGFDSYQQVYHRLNTSYQNSTNTLQTAKQALEACLENILQTDQSRAAAYLGFG